MSDSGGAVETAVCEALRQVLDGKGLPGDNLGRDRRLITDLGLKSLDLAQLVALLEYSLRVDPFARLVSITDVRTVGDLCLAYEKCLAAADPIPPPANAPPMLVKRSVNLTGDVRRSARGEAT